MTSIDIYMLDNMPMNLKNKKKGDGAYTPPLDFCSFDYFFIGTDVRIQDHAIIPWTFLVLEKK